MVHELDVVSVRLLANVEFTAPSLSAPWRAGHSEVLASKWPVGSGPASGPLRRYPVRDYEEGLAWYKRLLGSEPNFVPHATEAVWELAEHRFLFIVERPEHAGHAMHTIFVGARCNGR